MKKHNRPIEFKAEDEQDYVNVINIADGYIVPSLKLHPESAAFLFFIDGCAKNLLLYIIIHELNIISNKYRFNEHVKDNFSSYCKEIFGNAYTDTTIMQAHRDLVKRRITLNVSRGQYFLNPLVAGGKSESDRRINIREYSKLLISKKMDTLNELYPIYNRELK